MTWLFDIINFFERMRPRRRDDPFLAECRRATRQAFWSTVNLLLMLGVSWFAASLLETVGRPAAFELVANALRNYAFWGLLALHLYFTLQVLSGCWALFRVYSGRWQPQGFAK